MTPQDVVARIMEIQQGQSSAPCHNINQPRQILRTLEIYELSYIFTIICEIIIPYLSCDRFPLLKLELNQIKMKIFPNAVFFYKQLQLQTKKVKFKLFGVLQFLFSILFCGFSEEKNNFHNFLGGKLVCINYSSRRQNMR